MLRQMFQSVAGRSILRLVKPAAFCFLGLLAAALAGCNQSTGNGSSGNSAAARQLALEGVQKTTREFNRRKLAFEIAEDRYFEELHLWGITFAALEARSNPGSFAGDLPKHDEYAYYRYVEAAESMIEEAGIYLDVHCQPGDSIRPSLEQLHDEARNVIAMPPPFTGSRVKDALAAVQSAKFDATVKSTTGLAVQLPGAYAKKYVPLGTKYLRDSGLVDKATELLRARRASP